nr:NADH dehydrogenase subunit 6 [Planocera cf. pellucida MK-2019C]BEU28634.1 NADH dehydrogenase subunit 6 [Planocera cf. pellucida MK-2019C]BEU28646.1 NADH dehydrogenase subunit 6 [Planocera cf. pellucida MK-2019C]
MSFMVWFLLLGINYMCLFSLNSLILGLFILLCSFCVSLLISIYSLSWYSLIFFLVYIGGLLVLFIYISSLNFNPIFYISKLSALNNILLKLNILFFFLFVLTQITWNFNGFFWNNSETNNFSFNLFNDVEILFLINVGVLLLIVLWVITKLSFRNRSALRPFFS